MRQESFDSLRLGAKSHLSGTSLGSPEKTMPPALQIFLEIKCDPRSVIFTLVNFPREASPGTLIFHDMYRLEDEPMACW